jgi:hypothetical protein
MHSPDNVRSNLDAGGLFWQPLDVQIGMISFSASQLGGKDLVSVYPDSLLLWPLRSVLLTFETSTSLGNILFSV